MEMDPQCVPCLIRRVLFESEQMGGGRSVDAVCSASRTLGRLFRPGVCSATVATQVHREVYDLLGTKDPYERLKRKSNKVALGLFPEAERFVRESEDALRDAFLCAVVGNVLDFGISTGYDEPTKLKSEFKNLVREGLRHDDTGKIKRMLAKSDRVVYLADNCGEIILDRLALIELRKFEIDLTVVVKEEPILTDATLKDIKGLGIEKIADHVAEAPGFAVGIDLDSLGGWFGKLLRDADLIVAKGMANFESLSETDIAPVSYLLRTKCEPVSKAMGLRKDINAVKLFAKGARK